MKPWLAFAVLSAGASLVAFNQASAQPIEGLHGPAVPAIEAEIRARDISDVFEANVFYGDFDDNGREDAISFVYYPSDGNSFMLATWIWRQGENGYTLLRAPSTDEIFGIEPRDFAFAQGAVEVTTTVPTANDPRCCPTGERRFVLPVDEEAGSQSQPLVAQAVIQTGPLPFRDGRYLSDTSMCALSVEQIVARVGDEIHYMLYEIAAPHFNGVESFCTVSSASRSGDTVDIRATCEEEGTVHETTWAVDFVSPTAFRSGGTTYRLCE